MQGSIVRWIYSDNNPGTTSLARLCAIGLALEGPVAVAARRGQHSSAHIVMTVDHSHEFLSDACAQIFSDSC